MDFTFCQDRSCDADAGYMAQKIRQFWLAGEFCDYEIKTEGQAFQVHKVIMAAASDYFYAMLTHGMVESRENCVEFKGISAAGLAPLLDFIYGGNLNITEANVFEILTTASHLQVKPVIQSCCKHLSQSISFHNVLDVLKMAELFYLEEVLKEADQFIVNNFEAFAHKGLHLQLNAEQLIRYISRDDLNVMSEQELLNTVGEWFQHDFTNRSKYSSEVIECIRFTFMDQEEVVSTLSKEPFRSLDISFESLLEEAAQYRSLPAHKQLLVQSHHTVVRNKPAVVAFSGILQDLPQSTSSLRTSSGFYMLHDNNWLELGRSVNEIAYASMAVLDNFLFVCGGLSSDNTNATGRCFIFDPRLFRWSRIADLCRVRRWFPLVAGNGTVYALGGRDGGDHTDYTLVNSIEKYIPQKNKWVEIGNIRRTLHAACFLDGKIYVSGGFEEGDEVSNRLQCYDPDSNTWEEKSPMYTVHFDHTMWGIGDHIYVVDTCRDEVELYNLSTNLWTLVDFSVLPENAEVVHVGDDFIFVGGKSEEWDENTTCVRINLQTRESYHIGSYPEDVTSPLCCALAIPQDIINRAKLRAGQAYLRFPSTDAS